MSTSEVDSRSITISMRKSVENLVISSQDAIGQSISQALTFSGVITQHANQIIQETRSVSRSPSPSLRGSDVVPDSLDNDKCSESSLHVPSSGSGDSVSISSASDLATVVSALPTKADGSKGVVARGAEGGRAKKKSWYNSLYPTYKSKSDDFKRLFKELPDDERLIVDYSCALQKDILVHGRLYASQNYLCFHASIFGWETSLALRWKEVTAITKEKTALVIPNAILVCTWSERHFLTSFSGRDKAYLMLFRVWQNALMDQPINSHEIWQWVHSCYGEELGFNSDDEGYGRDFPEEVSLPLDQPDAEVKQLKKMWQNLKAKAREAKTLEAQRKRTGGGPPPPETGSLESQVLSIMPSIMPVISVPIDSDTTAEPFGSGQEDDDTLYWQHKRAWVILENDLINETFMVIPDDLDMTHNAPDCKINKTLSAEPEMRKETPIENHTQDTSNMLLFTPKQQIQKICNGSAKQKKSFDDVKKDLLLQELDNNKKRFLYIFD